MNVHRLHRALLALLLVYWTISLRQLTVVPRVYEDEPWQASTGWKLATEGVLGSDLFAGFYNMENRYYGYMPLHPLFLAGVFRFAGVGLFQARFEAVSLGLLTLALTHSLARRLFKDSRIGLLSIVLLIGVRSTGLTPSQVSGILFLDMARIARYDMVVPVFGLASLHAYLSARERGRAGGYVLSGFLAGLSGLAHLYGVFWLPALILLTLWDAGDAAGSSPDNGLSDKCCMTSPTLRLRATHPERSETQSKERGAPLRVLPYFLARFRRQANNASNAPNDAHRAGRLSAVGYLVLGFGLPWLVYAVYVLGDVYAWRGQTRSYADRFDLLNPGWYLDNLLAEPRRYGPGLGPVGPGVLLRVGFWSALMALPLSAGALARRAWRYADRSARSVLVPAVVLPILFAFLIRLKLSNYLVTIAPIWALAMAWGGVALWTRLDHASKFRRGRWALAVLLIAVVAEGATRIAALESAASTMTPYDTYIDRVRRLLPAGARVLGLHTYWFGLEGFDYRSIALPFWWADPAYEPRPLSISEGLDRIAPEIVLIEPEMREHFGAGDHDSQADAARFFDWLDRRGGELIGRVEDSTYGLMEVYRMTR
jgi:4-amino-4-deoxy-L-arabinose transferase-like glycosyltransferase